MTRTIFIGDVHACFDEFIELLEKIGYDKQNDKLYLTGDFLNKGPKSFEILDYLVKHNEIKSVIGNHEVHFLKYLTGEKGKFDEIFEKLKMKLSDEHIDYVRNLPLYIEKDNWILLHAGIVPGKDLKDHKIDEITKIRKYNNKPWYDFYDGDKIIIYGHWAADGINIKQKTKGLDSGCLYGKRLTAYILETGEIVQVGAKNNYKNIFS